MKGMVPPLRINRGAGKSPVWASPTIARGWSMMSQGDECHSYGCDLKLRFSSSSPASTTMQER